MGLRRYGTFTGGIDLPEEKHATLDSPIRPCRRPAVLRVPLGSCGRPAQPLVVPGQYVSAGERIAVAASYDSVDVFAPLPGRVVGVVQTCTVTPGGFAPCPAVELADLGDPPDLREPAPVFDWRSADAGTLVQRIAEGGLTVHRRPCESLARWLQRAGRNSCHLLVANVMEDQPYVTADHRLLAEHGTAVVRGLAILAQAAEIGQVVIVVDHRRTNDYRELVGPARMYAISRIALSHKYPGGADPMLAKVLTRREMPPGADPMDLGVAVIDAATCFAAYRWVAGGVPATARVVTASGGRAPAPGNYWAPFGTACADLVGLGESISP
jgi:electron transport complex protein RnfC